MKLEVPKGKYVLAVSGGVDSVALLDMLAKKSGIELIVAHFNHGIRSDSDKDEKLVVKAAEGLGLKWVVGYGNLGETASEEAARDARYAFLKQVQADYGAKAIITAHHQDDLIETALTNVIRGTGRLGLSAITANKAVLRPLLNTPKASLVSYAHRHKLKWRDDSTNSNTDYQRNYLRLKVLPKLTAGQRQQIVNDVDKVAKINSKLNKEIATLSQSLGNEKLNREKFTELSANIGNELVAHILRQAEVADFDSKTVNRLSMAIKTSRPNSIHHVKKKSSLKVGVKTASLITP